MIFCELKILLKSQLWKITGQLYTMGVPYENQRIISSVYAMTTDPIL